MVQYSLPSCIDIPALMLVMLHLKLCQDFWGLFTLQLLTACEGVKNSFAKYRVHTKRDILLSGYSFNSYEKSPVHPHLLLVYSLAIFS